MSTASSFHSFFFVTLIKLMVKCLLLVWVPVVWIPIGSPNMKGIGILRGILRIPNHWAPNQQFAIIVEVTSKVVYLEISEHTVDENTSC